MFRRVARYAVKNKGCPTVIDIPRAPQPSRSLKPNPFPMVKGTLRGRSAGAHTQIEKALRHPSCNG